MRKTTKKNNKKPALKANVFRSISTRGTQNFAEKIKQEDVRGTLQLLSMGSSRGVLNLENKIDSCGEHTVRDNKHPIDFLAKAFSYLICNRPRAPYSL